MANPTAPARHQRKRRAIRRRLIAAGAAVIVGTGTGVGIAKAQASGGPGYRTAVASMGNAVRTLTVSGTVQPVNQAQASFQVSGTVSGVEVSVGQSVSAGQVLATLDTTSLQTEVSLAQANLSSAEAKLSQDESGQASTTASSNSGGSTQPTGAAQTSAARVENPTSGNDAILTAASLPSGTASLQQAQQAVVSAQHSADVDIQTATANLAAAQTTCQTATGGAQSGGNSGSQGSTTTTTTPASTTTTTVPSTTTTTPAAGSGSGATSACSNALEEAMTTEQQVSRDQVTVQNAEKTLAQVLTSELSSASSNGNHTSTGSAKSGSGSASAAATATNSASQLASDQASIDSDQASLVSAQQSLQAGTLTAPIAGTVASVNIAVGQALNAGSASNSVTVANSGAYQTVSSLTTSQVGQVNVGDPVEVTGDGQSTPVAGIVSRVGPVETSSSSYTYPLIVSLDADSGHATGMPAGSAAQVQVQIAHADNTLVVPTSAVHTAIAGNSYVIVLQGTKQVRKPVTTGVVGQTYTQVAKGLASGTVVVLADPSQPVPSSSTNSNTFRIGVTGGAGFPGGFQRFVTGGGG